MNKYSILNYTDKEKIKSKVMSMGIDEMYNLTDNEKTYIINNISLAELSLCQYDKFLAISRIIYNKTI